MPNRQRRYDIARHVWIVTVLHIDNFRAILFFFLFLFLQVWSTSLYEYKIIVGISATTAGFTGAVVSILASFFIRDMRNAIDKKLGKLLGQR